MSASPAADQPYDHLVRMLAIEGKTIEPNPEVPSPTVEDKERLAKENKLAEARKDYRKWCKFADIYLVPLAVFSARDERTKAGEPAMELDEFLQALDARTLGFSALRSSHNRGSVIWNYDDPALLPAFEHLRARVIRGATKWCRNGMQLLAKLTDARLQSSEVPPQTPQKPGEARPPTVPPLASAQKFLTMKERKRLRQLLKDFCKKLPPLTNSLNKPVLGPQTVSALGDLELIVALEISSLEKCGEPDATPILAAALNEAAGRLLNAIPSFTDPDKATELALQLLKIRMQIPVPLAPKVKALLRASDRGVSS